MADVDLRQYVNVVWRRKWLILAIVAVVVGSVAAVMIPAPFIYRATATMLIESKDAYVVSIQDVYGAEARGLEYYQTQYEILKSRPVVAKVIDALALQNVPELAQYEDKIVLSRAALEERYLHQLRISPVPRSHLVKISFDARDPQLAAAIANAHADAFIDTYLEAKESATHSATRWLSTRLEELRTKLTTAEKNLQAFKEREHIIDVDGFQALPARELNEMTTKLIDARRDLSQTGNAYAQISQARNVGLDEKLAIPAIRADRIVQQLGQARADADLKVMELSKRYGPLHTKMKAAISERASTEAALMRQVDSVMDAIKNEHEVLQGQERSIAGAVSKTQSNVQLQGRMESEYRALVREVDTNRQLYDLFNKRISETRETGDLNSANARVVEPAAIPLAPVSPQKTLMLVLAVILSLLIGLMLAFLLEYIDNTIKHPTDVEQRLGLPLLGIVPMLKGKKKVGLVGTALKSGKDRDFGEAIRTVRTSIALSSLERPSKTILVTSTLPSEGKTALACNLAAAFAHSERVLLIDADLRRPSIATELDMDRKLPGLANLCAGTAALADCIKRGGTYDVILAGAALENPQELFGSPRFGTLLSELADSYDRIIIDSPPTLPVTDVLLLANNVDALVYVVKAGATTTRSIKAGIQRVRRTPVVVLGVVLNQVDLKKLAAYGDYGGSYYGDNYYGNSYGKDTATT